MPILTLLIMTPLLGALASFLFPNLDKKFFGWITVGLSLVTVGIIVYLLSQFDTASNAIQFAEKVEWISSLNVEYSLGVDGISVGLIALNAVIFLVTVLFVVRDGKGSVGFLGNALLSEALVFGILLAQDLFLYFLFWNALLVPIYFFVAIWGEGKRESAGTRFFLNQLLGSAFLFLGMVVIYYSTKAGDLSFSGISKLNLADFRVTVFNRTWEVENLSYILFAVGFAFRMAVIPFHSWFIEVQSLVSAPIAALIAGVFVKTGGYGFIRLCYALFPRASANWGSVVAIIGGVSVIYCAFCALGQKDFRRLIAYACLSYTGFFLIGIGVRNETSFNGAVLNLFAHSFFSTLIILLVGILCYKSKTQNFFEADETQTFGGVIQRAPKLAGFFVVAIFAMIGMPGLGGFSSDMMVFIGAFQSHPGLSIVGLFGVLFTGIFTLRLYRVVFLGKQSELSSNVDEISVKEQGILIPLVIGSLVTGVYPAPILNFTKMTVLNLLSDKSKSQPSPGANEAKDILEKEDSQGTEE